jgi:hypothetical protein
MCLLVRRMSRGGELSSYAERMSKKNKINRADKIDKTTRRTRYSEWARAQRGQNVFDRKRGWNLDARVMLTERMQLMCVGSGDQWFAELPRGFFCAPVWVKKTLVKMAEFDGIEAIDFREQPRPD